MVTRSIQTGAGHVEHTRIGHQHEPGAAVGDCVPVGSIAGTEATRSFAKATLF